MQFAHRLTEHARCACRTGGFTLVELAVVVVIIAMMLTMGLTALNAQLTSASYTETKKRQSLVKDALIAYLGANKRLPCPDAPNNTNGTDDASQVTGAEDRAGGVGTGACTVALGVVPYATLGLGRDAALEGWGNFMSYRVSVSPAPACPGNGIDWSMSLCFGLGKTGSLSIYEGFAASPALVATGVIAVVVSHGPNGLGAWAQQGSRNTAPVSCEEAHNSLTAGCAITANRLYKGERPENDDVVAFVTKDEAIAALAKTSNIKSPSGQVIDDLTSLMDDALGVVLVNGCNYAEGATPGTPRVAAPTIRDPWGNNYLLADNIKHKGIKDTGGALVTLNNLADTAALCVYSLGLNAGGTVTAGNCAATNDAIAKGLNKSALDGFIAKAGKPNC